ncbi:MAG: putative DNA binding domain-containing protein [Spirochaetaceae bacterium]|nr:putative DNA binding domain-containing protein [Spirochaetaceae bacterium]
MNLEQIKSLLKTGENIGVEFKRCGNGIESDTYETVCSFANRFGGDIFCGVLDDGSIQGLNENSLQSTIKNFISIISDATMFNPTLFLIPEVIEIEGKKILHIHVPVSSEVHTYKRVIYDRINESDVKVTSTSRIASLYIRKQNIFTEQKVYKYVQIDDFRSDIISLCRQRAINKRSDHPWRNLSDMELLKSAKLYTEDYETGEKGFNLAAILLLGKDEVIGSVCPTYKTDALVRKINLDRYDDREIIQTNLIESYDLLINFARKHLNDKFFMEETQTVSLRDKIVREMISNILMHREFTSSYIAKFVIEENKMYTENACRASKQEKLTPENFIPISKNPIIASFFTNIGNADELGSGTRNIFKYTKLYSGTIPEILEDDIFKIIVPLNNNYSFDANTKKESETKIHLSVNQEKILQEIKNDSSVTAKILSEKIGISERKIQDNLKFLKEKNLISRIGGNKNGKWICN